MKLSVTSLEKQIFWDSTVSDLDMETHAEYIIPRVMDYGMWEDVKFILRYYGKTKIKQILFNAPSLQKKTISFFAWYFSVSQQSFKANNNRIPEWTY